jgi:hypothetical protein
MPKRLLVAAAVVAVLTGFSLLLGGQTAPGKGVGGKALPPWDDAPPQKAAYTGIAKAPAPRRDLSGFWNAEAEGGIQPTGALEHPDTKSAGPLQYTSAGLAALAANKPTAGAREVRPGSQNDPVDICDPGGFPRIALSQFRVLELEQTASQVIAVYQPSYAWRVIWTDGRTLPDLKSGAEPRWNGYSIGRWVDDYTFVAQTDGMDERSWVDNAGRPHTTNMRVEERFHRVDSDTLELTLTIDDPEYYKQPWQALNKFVLHRLPDDFDMGESFCSPSAIPGYKKLLDNVTADK